MMKTNDHRTSRPSERPLQEFRAPKIRRVAAAPLLTSVSLLALLFLGLPRQSTGMPYGVGDAWVTKVLGEGTWHEKEIKDKLEETEAKLKTSSPAPDLNYSAAILKLNSGQSYRLESIRQTLEKTLAADPGYQDAFELWLALNPEKDELERVTRALEESVKKESDAPYARLYLGECLRYRKEPKRALDLFRELTSSEDKFIRGRALLGAAAAAFEAKDDVQGTKLYEELANEIPKLDPRVWELVAAQIYVTASAEEIEELKSLSPQERPAFILRFWKRRDPRPTTPENERLGCHYRRLKEARTKYPLTSNGNGYFTSRKQFLDYSPELEYYKSRELYRYLEGSYLWVDMRGLMYIRHGEPDITIRSTSSYRCNPGTSETCTADRSETWIYSSTETMPLIFHLIRRRGVQEYVLTLNLALAAVRASWARDDPDEIIFNVPDLRPLYESVSYYDPVFRELSIRTSRNDIQYLLEEESRMMANYVKGGIRMDNPDPLEKKFRLKYNLASADFKTPAGKTQPRLYYSVPLSDQKFEKGVKDLEFESTVIVYDRDWKDEITRLTDVKTAVIPTKKAKDIQVMGELLLPEMEPDAYNFVYQVSERKTGKTGVAKGKYVVPYFGGSWVEASDLILSDSIVTEGVKGGPYYRDGTQIVPNPSSIISKNKKAYVYYELYNLTKDEQGKVRYKVNLQFLTLRKTPGPLKKILGVTLGVARLIFPYEMFIADASLFGLDALRKSEKRGIVREEGIHEEALDGDTKYNYFEVDTSKFPRGIYQLYLTIEDLNNKSVTTKDVRMMID